MSATVLVVGSSAAVPNPGEATSGYLYRCGDASILLDCGHGVVGRLTNYLAVEHLSAVIISHMHPDHWWDLVALRSSLAASGGRRLSLYVPESGEAILGAVGEALSGSRDYFAKWFDVSTYGPDEPIIIANVRVDALRVKHDVETNALKLRCGKDSTLVYTSDTAFFHGLAEFASGATIMIAEATLGLNTRRVTSSWHMNASDLVTLIQRARPSVSILTHFFADEIEGTMDQVRHACPDKRIVRAEEGCTFRV